VECAITFLCSKEPGEGPCVIWVVLILVIFWWPYCFVKLILCSYIQTCRSRWPRGLKACVFTTPRLLGLRIRILLCAWMFVSCECCVLSDRDLCVGLIIRPGKSYRVWCVLSVIEESHSGGLGPQGRSEPRKEIFRCTGVDINITWLRYKSCGKLHCVLGWLVPKKAAWTWRWRPYRFFKSSQPPDTKDWNLQQHQCENLHNRVTLLITRIWYYENVDCLQHSGFCVNQPALTLGNTAFCLRACLRSSCVCHSATAIISVNGTNHLMFVMEADFVLCEVM